MVEEERENLAGTIIRGNAGVLLTLVVQSCVVVWAMSGLFTRVDALTAQVIELRADFKVLREKAYTVAEAVKDLGRLESGIALLNSRIEKIEERVREHEKVVAGRS